VLEHVVDYGVLDEVEVGGIWKLDATVERNQRRPREAGGELLSTGSEFERLRPLSCGAAAVSTEVGAFQRPHLPPTGVNDLPMWPAMPPTSPHPAHSPTCCST